MILKIKKTHRILYRFVWGNDGIEVVEALTHIWKEFGRAHQLQIEGALLGGGGGVQGGYREGSNHTFTVLDLKYVKVCSI